jgi:opacity protein-like surface antigen
MSRTKAFSLAGLTALLVFGAQLTQAQGLGIGAHYSNVRNQDTEDHTSMLGAMARLRGRYVGLEGAIDYRNEKMGGNTELKTWPVTASLLVYPVPFAYGIAGLGWYNTTLDFANSTGLKDQTDSQLGYHLGAGLEVPLSPGLALTGDFRYQFINYKFDEIPSSIGNVDADRFALSAGLLLYLQ